MLWDPRRRETRESEPAPWWIALINVHILVGLLLVAAALLALVGWGIMKIIV